MTAPMVLNDNDLLVRPGDGLVSPIWAVLTTAGGPFSLDGWNVVSQARLNQLESSVFQEFSITNGKILVDSATVTSPVTGESFPTSTIQLVLGPDDTAGWPRLWLGIYDVRIDHPGPPSRRYTVVPVNGFYVVGTVTR